jgi:hypothetical protein
MGDPKGAQPSLKGKSILKRSSLLRSTLLLLCGLSAWALEVRLELPSPVITNAKIEAWVILEGEPDARIERIDFPDIPGLKFDLERRKQRTTIFNGKRVTRFGANVIAAELGTWQVPGPTVVFTDGSSIQASGDSLTASGPVDYLEGLQPQARITVEPTLIIPGQEALCIQRVYLRHDSEHTLADDWSIPLPDEAISLGEASTRVGFLQDKQQALWRVHTRRVPFTVAKEGSHLLGGQVDILERTRFGNRRVGSIAAQPATLIVEPLPEGDAPDDYTGLVGSVAVAGELARDRIVSGEGTELTLTITGPQAGLVDRLALPEVPGLRFYEEEDDRPSRQVRRFVYQVVPSAPGSFVIPAFTVPWLDPVSRDFRRAASSPLTLTVLPGRVRSVESNPAGDLGAMEVLALPAPQRTAGSTPFASSLVWWVLGGAALLGAALASIGRLSRLQRSGPHRGHLLRRALAQGDLDQADALANQLVHLVTDGAKNAEIQAAIRALEHARFGGTKLDEQAREGLRSLEELP